jgi:predicted amidohydrolase YtcJ
VLLTGGPDLAAPPAARLGLGPVKIVLDESAPPDWDELVATVAAARAVGRAVAFHCVTRLDVVQAVAALRAVGVPGPADRLEHAAVLPPALVELVASAGVTVVTQPHFIAERGDEYRTRVDPDDLPWLYRCAGVRAAGIPLAAGTDAPFGSPDPWASARAAVERRTPSGAVLGPGEALDPLAALGLYLGPADRPGAGPRRIRPGMRADLCLLALPRRAALAELSAEAVAVTIVGGRVVADRRVPRDA